jgi:hypothetical protein
LTRCTLRGDAARGFILGGLFSTSQFIAVLLFVASAVLLAVRLNDAERPRVVNRRRAASLNLLPQTVSDFDGITGPLRPPEVDAVP